MAMTILLVDDDEFAREFCKIVLMRAGHTVVEAGEVAEALPMALLSIPQVALVDYYLPDGTGVLLARCLHEQLPNLPVILISGDTSELDTIPEGAREFAAILKKPYRASELTDAIVAVSTV